MKKIAIVTYSLNIGGVEAVIFNLGKCFMAQGFEVEVIETLNEGPWKKYFTDNGFKVVSIVKSPLKTAISHANQIGRYLQKFDIILLNDAPYAQSVLGKLQLKILIFPILHLNLPSMAFNAAGNKGQWTKIVAVSPFLKNFILQEIPSLNDSEVSVITNGIDTNKFSYKQTIPAPGNKRRIMFLGRIAEEKGILLLPEIVVKLKNHPLFEKLDIYGTGGLEQPLKDKIEELDLGNKIFLKGAIPHDRVNETFGDYNILIMPSYKEGHPIVLLEAMSTGLVPVVSRIEGSTDIVINNNVNGYLCEPGNIDQFASTLHHAIESDRLPAMSLEARKTIVEKYTIDTMAQSYLKLFETSSYTPKIRSNKLDRSLLGDLPFLPYILVRPVRKALRVLGLWTKN